MKRFKEFFEQENSEEVKDVARTLAKIPTSHANLVRGFKWRFHAGNTLNGDNDHVGYMDDDDREIAIAAPYNYSREFCGLHEIAHKVWKAIGPELQQQWIDLVNSTKDKVINKNNKNQDSLNQNPEELFCHTYSNFYVKHKLVTYSCPEWMNFIKNLR